jgi:glycosyltransferase involved in cell wall biosynthesis
MKIHWFSNAPWASTGYGNQTKTFIHRFKAAGHAVSVTALYGLEGAKLDLNGIPVYPRGMHQYGLDVVASHAAIEQADVIISLIDAWVLNAETMQASGVPWFPWFPVDTEPLPDLLRGSVAGATGRIVFSKSAEEAVNNAGLDCWYVPHGVDYLNFYNQDKGISRQKTNLPNDRFIAGMVSANWGVPSRKSFAEQLEGFAIFARKHTDALLYLHTRRGDRGEPNMVNLSELVGRLGIQKNVMFADQVAYNLGYGEDTMRGLYNSFDVLLGASMGEGFGIPIVEAQMCGTPVIVGDWTAMSELVIAGHAIPRERAHKVYNPIAAYQYSVEPQAVADALETAYAGAYRSGARVSKETAALYSADVVMEKYWKPVLAKVEQAAQEWQARRAPRELMHRPV